MSNIFNLSLAQLFLSNGSPEGVLLVEFRAWNRQYFARCFLVSRDGEGKEDFVDYAIHSLHSMIDACARPYNDGHILQPHAI